MLASNRRRVPRFPFHSLARLQIEREIFFCQLVDISMGGALLETTETIPPAFDVPCSIDIIQLSGRVCFQADAQLAHIHGRVAGIAFHHLDDSARAALTRIARLNLAPAEILNREVPALLRPQLRRA